MSEDIQRRLRNIEARILKVEERCQVLDKDLARSKDLLGIIQRIAFGGVGLVLTSIAVALLALVVKGLSS